MKKVLLSMAAVTAIAAAATPAAADHDRRGYGAYAPHRQINAREFQLAREIERAERSHRISSWEARRLSRELGQIEVIEKRYRHNGLSRREVADLSARLDRLQATVQHAVHDGGRRYGYGYDNRYGDWRW